MKKKLHSTSTKPIKRNDTIGAYYELPDGRVAFVTGWYGREKGISYRFENGKSGFMSDEVFQTWKYRKDLKDYPNSKDPVLPYEFDLHYDIKRMSELRRFVNNEDNPKILQHLRELIGRYKIPFVNIKKGFK